jgi:hypothetical protein
MALNLKSIASFVTEMKSHIHCSKKNAIRLWHHTLDTEGGLDYDLCAAESAASVGVD